MSELAERFILPSVEYVLAGMGEVNSMANWIVPTIGIVGVTATAFYFWYANMYRGSVRMENPSFITLGYEPRKPDGRPTQEEIVTAAHLSSTGKRGHKIQSLDVKVSCEERSQVFDIWRYGDDMVAGGMNVNDAGVTAKHHFNHQKDMADLGFLPGQYELEVRAYVVGSKPTSLLKVKLGVPDDPRLSNPTPSYKVWFNWRPESKSYSTHVEEL
jgi:hypothetical protein